MKKLTLPYLAGLAAALTLAVAAPAAIAQERTLAVSGSGGIVGEMNTRFFAEPFTAETGIAVERLTSEGSRMAELEAMVNSGRVLWDVMEISASNYPLGVSKGLFEPIDYSKVDPEGLLPPGARAEYGVGAASFSHVLAVRTDQMPEGRMMSSWADFWDVETFPGPRALRNRAEDNLEFALLADGVAEADLYTVLSTEDGLDRAFAKMDEIKPHVTAWWTSGAQSVQLLSDGEVYFGTSYNGRIPPLAQSGLPVEIMWNGGALHTSFVGIPKGTENIEMAHQFIAYRTMNAAQMRQYMAELPYPGFAPGLYDGVAEAVTAIQPTAPANLEAQFSANPEFWGDNLEAIQERWNEWLLE
ncbi:ABC transporter substrate-binding protein [Aestuariivita sp.]|jgi:putative spermidine/putrescine transport system substrate-binding protein|uniref:ABC transporter substrate-binding protein n=1 Tax=Aestuariivita sp. TaxID=1872407 RepID=UPI00216FC0E7|nr:ABC transporter substrate-binding protein [Aestuariivita sp.]MCE8009564.1 ABC transporter substrate-binding protein [Aestuariivita sp.]